MTENELMLTTLLGCSRVDLFTNPVVLTDRQRTCLAKMKTRRLSGEPLQYILGSVDFMGLTIKVDPRVLIPRPETEILVETAILHLKSVRRPLKVLDLGTGSGNIAIALAKYIEDIHVTSVDTSCDALILASENVKMHRLEPKIRLVYDDMKSYLKKHVSAGPHWDMIISNPPYISKPDLPRLPEDVKREPEMALDGGKDGLMFYRAICEAGHRILFPGGCLMVEMGDGQLSKIQSILRKYPYRNTQSIKDYVGTERILMTFTGEAFHGKVSH